MKLIAISDGPYALTAKFSIDGEEYFLDWFKTRDEMQILDNDAEYLDFTREQCEDLLVELKKQYNHKRK